MKTMLAALAIAVPAAVFSGAAPVQADTGVSLGIYFGVPYYRDKPGHGYVYRPGFGWYDGRRNFRDRLSCAEARRAVRNRGYRIIRTRDCDGKTYAFRVQRNGNRFVVYVNSRTGRIWRG